MSRQHLPVAYAGMEMDTHRRDTAARFASAGHPVARPFLFHWWDKPVEMQTQRDPWRDDGAMADINAGLYGVHEGRLCIVGYCWGGRMARLGVATKPTFHACAVFHGGRIRQAMGRGMTSPIGLTADRRCAVMGFFGNEDQYPSPARVDDSGAALRSAHMGVVFHRHGGAGHGMQTFTEAERHHQQANGDAWATLLHVFDDSLERPKPPAST